MPFGAFRFSTASAFFGPRLPMVRGGGRGNKSGSDLLGLFLTTEFGPSADGAGTFEFGISFIAVHENVYGFSSRLLGLCARERF